VKSMKALGRDATLDEVLRATPAWEQ
jgi:hypothetical protein